jgi:hypothetical protein
MQAGAPLLLEDTRPADRSRAVPATSIGFFEKVFGKGGANLTKPGAIGSVNIAGLITDGMAGGTGTFGAAGAKFSSFFDTGVSNALLTNGPGTEAAAREAVLAEAAAAEAAKVEEGDDGRDYDPLAGRTRGLGKVFLEFDTAEAARVAMSELAGRAFNRHIIVTSFAAVEAYNAGEVCDFAACHVLPDPLPQPEPEPEPEVEGDAPAVPTAQLPQAARAAASTAGADASSGMADEVVVETVEGGELRGGGGLPSAAMDEE